MKDKIIGLIMILFLGVCSCNRDDVFEKEQYKNVFALISGSNNISEKYHLLGQASTGYISVSCGGTNATKEDITIQLVEDASLLHDYNTANYDVDMARYARLLPSTNYTISSYQLTIPAGQISARLPVVITPDGLSPDSSYVIPLRVESYSACEINPLKNYVLYEVRIKNYWANGDGTTSYSMKSKITEDDVTIEVPGTKTMAPLDANTVRIMAGNETYESNLAVLNKAAIVLTIDTTTNKVSIRPYKTITVHQIDGDADYPNIFKTEDDGYGTYKTFLLHYDYTIDNKTYQIKEELRLEFDKEEETE